MKSFLVYLVILSISAVIGFLNLRLADVKIKTMIYCICFTFFVEWLSYYLLYINPQKELNGILHKMFMPIEFCFVASYFYQIVIGKKERNVVLFLSVVVIAFEIMGIILRFPLFQIIMSAYFGLSIFSLIYLRFLMHTENNISLNPHFWIVTGILFFNAGFFFLSGFINYISQKDIELARKLFRINHVLNIIYYSLITYSFICQRRLARS